MRSLLSPRSYALVAAIAVGFSALALAASRLGSDLFSFSGGEKAPEGVVHRTDLKQQVTVAGTIVPLRRTLFTPPYSAYIRKIFVHLGEQVKENTPVVELTQTAKGIDEDVHPLRAPFTGTVVQVLKSEGEYVDTTGQNNGIVRIDDLTRLFINSAVPESDIAKIRTGQDVLIKANAILSRQYHGIIRDIALAATEKKEWSRSGDRVEFDVRIEIMDKDDQLRPGMSATVDIITAKRPNVLSLAHEYIEKEDGKYYVTLENGKKHEVGVGLQNEELFEITRGLKENEKVKMVDFFNLPKVGE